MEIEKKICWRITRYCNLQCVHCLAGYGNQFRPNLTLEQEISGLNTIIRFGITRITWTGGEPTLCASLPVLLGICHSHGIRSIITTHGLALNDKLLHTVNPHLDCFRFSIDGLEETHNAIRGGVFYSRTMNAIIRCRNLGLTVEANVSVLDKNISEIPELLSVLAEQGISKIVLMTLMYRESAIDNAVLGPSELQVAMLMEGIAKFLQTNHNVRVQLNNYGDVSDMYIVIESDGEILLCSESCGDQSFGSLLDNKGGQNLQAALVKQTLAHRSYT